MKTKAISPIAYLTGLLLVLSNSIFTSCKDEITSAGIELMPDAGYFIPKYDESTGMTAQNTMVPIRTDDALNGTLGVYEDTIFGTIKSDFLLQMLPADTTVVKAEKDANNETNTLTKDGLYLHFAIKDSSWIGKADAVHKLKIYELKDNLSNEKYYADMSVADLYYETPLAETEVKASDGNNLRKITKKIVDGKEVNDTTYTWNDVSSWKIKLSQEIADRFWKHAQNPGYIANSNEAIRNVFLEFFKGLYVTSEMADETNKSYIPISFLTPGKQLSLVLHYNRVKTTTDAAGTKTETIKKDSVIYISTYERKRIARALPLTSGSIPSEPGNAENLFIQGMSGRASTIQMDTKMLYSWKDSLDQGYKKIGISDVELVLAIDQDTKFTKDHEPIKDLQIWLKRLNGDLTDQTWYSYANGYNGMKYGYVFQNSLLKMAYGGTSIGAPFGRIDTIQNTYNFKLDPNYFEAYLRFLNNPTDTTFTNTNGKFRGFTDKNADGSYKSIYDLSELLLMPASADRENQSASVANNIKRVVLESPTHTGTKTKLKIKYFEY